MVATARVLHAQHGPGLKIVFIGPCIAKKGEAALRAVRGRDRRRAHLRRAARPARRRAASSLGARRRTTTSTRRTAASAPSSPSRAACCRRPSCSEDLLSGDIVSADGRQQPRRRHHRLRGRRDRGDGCSTSSAARAASWAPASAARTPMFKRRSDVSRATRARQDGFDRGRLGGGDGRVRRHRPAPHLRRLRPALRRHAGAEELREILARMNKSTPEDELNCGACGYDTLPRPRRRHLAGPRRGRDVPALRHRGAAQDGRRAGGVATARWRAPRRPWSRARSWPAWASSRPASPTRSTTRSASCCCTPTCCSRTARATPAVADDVKLIVDQANRCKKIISGLLNFARQSRVVRQPTDLRALVDEVLRTVPIDEDVDGRRRRPPRRPRSPSSTPTRSCRCSPTCSPTPSTRCPTAAASSSLSTAPTTT